MKKILVLLLVFCIFNPIIVTASRIKGRKKSARNRIRAANNKQNTSNNLNSSNFAPSNTSNNNNVDIPNNLVAKEDARGKINNKIEKRLKPVLIELKNKMDIVKESCSGIKQEYDTIFGLNVASSVLSAVGTAASGAALATGIMKSNKDKEIEKKEEIFDLLKSKTEGLSQEEIRNKAAELVEILDTERRDIIEGFKKEFTENDIDSLKQELDKDIKKSKQLGNARTGLMMGATATSAISMGTSIGSVVGLKKLTEKMGSCNSALKDLKIVKGKVQAEINEIDDSEEKNKIEKEKLNTAKNVLENCKEFDSKVLTAMSNKSIASAFLSGIGTATGLVGTITSAIANTDKTRNDNSVSGKKKEKALNLTANITAGIVAGTSATSTILSGITAAQVKKESEKAGKCEEILNSI